MGRGGCFGNEVCQRKSMSSPEANHNTHILYVPLRVMFYAGVLCSVCCDTDGLSVCN